MTRRKAEHEGDPLAGLTKRIGIWECVTKPSLDPPQRRGPRDMRAIQPYALLREPSESGKRSGKERKLPWDGGWGEKET